MEQDLRSTSLMKRGSISRCRHGHARNTGCDCMRPVCKQKRQPARVLVCVCVRALGMVARCGEDLPLLSRTAGEAKLKACITEGSLGRMHAKVELLFSLPEISNTEDKRICPGICVCVCASLHLYLWIHVHMCICLVCLCVSRTGFHLSVHMSLAERYMCICIFVHVV